MPVWLSCLGTLAAVAAVVFTLFWRADSAVTKQTKRIVAGTLRKDIHRMTLELVGSFSFAFDGVFGRRLLSRRFLLASATLSFAFSVIFTFMWTYLGRPHQVAGLTPALDYPDPIGGLTASGLAWNWLWIFILITLPADFLSNVETRLVLRRARGRRQIRRLFLWLALDLVFSLAIFAGWFFIVIGLYQFWHGASFQAAMREGFNKTFELFRYGLLLSNDTHVQRIGKSTDGLPINVHTLTLSNGIFLYTSLCTSIWLWLHMLSSFIVTLAFSIERLRKPVVGWFDVDDSPFTFLGYVATVVAVSFVVFLLLLL